MDAIKKWIRNLFGFSGREVNGFLILLPLMVIIIVAQPIYTSWLSNRTEDFSNERKTLDSLITFWEHVPEGKLATPVRLFGFDPNKATKEEFEVLGFTEGLSTRITNYRQKGGQFRIKSDLMKIYGMDSSFYRKLFPYIQLPENIQKRFAEEKSPLKKSKRALERFDLNTADTAQLKSVYGIGSTLAVRILKFRDGLGGFVKREQLNEVYGLDSAVIYKLLEVSFIEDGFEPRKINVNTASEKEFSSHPYIKKFMANAIVAYRFQHGNFSSVDDIRKLDLLRKDDISRILPYLKVDQ